MDEQLMNLVVRLETRTRQLLLQHQQLQKDYDALCRTVQEREEEILDLQVRNEELQQQYGHLKMAKYIDMADNDVKDMRGRIRKMVRDIDRCISMLKITDHE